MKLSVKAEYAVQAIFDLACQTSRDPVRIADIAQRQDIPQKFLELILASLRQAGFVESRRGAEGGYLLARAASSITVGEVLRHVEGTSTLRSREMPGMAEFWQRVDQSLSDVIDQTTFQDLARSWQESQHRFVENWEI
jgi:Rrf2 family transcriptional regulator, cysteine metabolism repressor